MELERKKYRIVATKNRTGERVAGITTWDGLSAIMAVTPDDGGETKFVSELDHIATFTEL